MKNDIGTYIIVTVPFELPEHEIPCQVTPPLQSEEIVAVFQGGDRERRPGIAATRSVKAVTSDEESAKVLEVKQTRTIANTKLTRFILFMMNNSIDEQRRE